MLCGFEELNRWPVAFRVLPWYLNGLVNPFLAKEERGYRGLVIRGLWVIWNCGMEIYAAALHRIRERLVRVMWEGEGLFTNGSFTGWREIYA